MSKVKVVFTHLHAPLFFAKKNWKEKIDARTDKGPQGAKIEMEYDRDEKELCLRCDVDEIFIPSSNMISYVPEGKAAAVVKPTSNASSNPKIQAQVSGPHDHVFAGQGAGKTK